MSNTTQRPTASASKRAQAVPKRALSGDEVKTLMRERGTTLKAWAEKHGYPYEAVSRVVRGVSRCNYGMGYRIAIALGMK